MFDFERTPKIIFGQGRIKALPGLVSGYGGRALIISGKTFSASKEFGELAAFLNRDGVKWTCREISGEPSPEMVDEIVSGARGDGICVVAAIGGGSAIDAGKAVSAMLTMNGSVIDYLEDVGTKAPTGTKIPFIAVPTTAGTGSEATKNAVISSVGPDGFKKSLRHDSFVPDVALIDPELALTCTPDVTAACGMDVFTQLLESFVSTKASLMTDALAWSGIECAARSLGAAWARGDKDIEARTGMAYAALMSGITLANAGLGLIHGLAGPIGGFFNIPHGVVCGTLIAECNAATIEKILSEYGDTHPAVLKFARVGALLQDAKSMGTAGNCAILIDTLREWTDRMRIRKLGEYGVTESDLGKIIAASGNKNNPINLSPEEIRQVLLKRL